MKLHQLLVSTLFCIFVAGCVGGTVVPRQYLLSPNEGITLESDKVWTLVVGPVELPDYLLQPYIVTRSQKQEIHVNRNHRWAEPLDVVITRVVAENIGQRLGTDRVLTYPWKGNLQLDYQIVLDIHRFERNDSKEVVLGGQWSLLDQARSVIATTRFELTEDIANQSYHATTQSMSQALARLAGSIASQIHQSASRID